MKSNHPRASDFRTPPPQRNLDRASELAFENLAGQPHDQLHWLGAETDADRIRVPVFRETIEVDGAGKQVTTSSGKQVGAHWRILILHYLTIEGRPEWQAPEITFADLTTARSYDSVYRERTIGRLCATAGRSESSLRAGAESLGGLLVPGGDLAYQFDVFPRLALRLVWHAPDDEFPASATILLPRNIEACFCAEDIVVLSERLVSRLCGRPF